MTRRTRTACAALLTAGLLLSAVACSDSSGMAESASSTSSTSSSSPVADGAGLPAVPEIVKEIEPSVVTIHTPVGLGSGVVYKSDGTIVTAAHVIENERGNSFETVRVQFADGKTSEAEVIAVDNVTDVGVIKAERSGLPVPEYASSPPEVGQMTVVVGSPLGLTETVTAGIVSGLHRNMPRSKENPQGLVDLIQVDAPISPGNSGGAAVNGDAVVIGLSEAYLPPSTGAVAIGFVTPATTVTAVADQLLKSGEATHAYLGVRPADISKQIAERLELPTTSGVLVVDVTDGGPADRAGMQAGDIVTEFAGSKIENVTALLAAIRQVNPGEQVDVVVRRGEDTETLTVTMGDRSDIAS